MAKLNIFRNEPHNYHHYRQYQPDEIMESASTSTHKLLAKTTALHFLRLPLAGGAEALRSKSITTLLMRERAWQPCSSTEMFHLQEQ